MWVTFRDFIYFGSSFGEKSYLREFSPKIVLQTTLYSSTLLWLLGSTISKPKYKVKENDADSAANGGKTRIIFWEMFFIEILI